jgi:ABC-2 type transport system permease protein
MRALLKKELKQQVRTYRLLIVVAVFVFFGLGSPLFAWLMPEILGWIGNTGGVTIEAPPPTYLEAMAQYVKNLSQIVLFVIIFLIMGSVSGEKELGTAAFVLVKPASRLRFILAKVVASWLVLLSGFICAAAACGLYTRLLFGTLPINPYILSNVTLLLYMLTITAITLFFSAALASPILSGIVSFLVWILLSVLSGLGRPGAFLPGELVAQAGAVFTGAPLPWEPFLGSVLIIAASLAGSFMVFRSWEP